MIVVAIFMCDARLVVFGLCAGGRMVAVLQTRSHSYRCSGSYHGAGAEEHNRVRKG
jgi:dienelactone hydrolase